MRQTTENTMQKRVVYAKVFALQEVIAPKNFQPKPRLFYTQLVIK